MATLGIAKFATKIVSVMLLAIIIDAAICAATGRWTLAAFITGLEYAGFLAMLWGGAALMDSDARNASVMHYAGSVAPGGMHKSIRRSTADLLGAYAHCILFGTAGILLWIFAAVIAPPL